MYDQCNLTNLTEMTNIHTIFELVNLNFPFLELILASLIMFASISK